MLSVLRFRFSEVINVKNNLLLFVSYRTPEQEMEERKCNYERYRGLVQNDFANSEYQTSQLMFFKVKELSEATSAVSNT